MKEISELEIQKAIEAFKSQYDSELEEYGHLMAKDLAVSVIDHWMWKYTEAAAKFNQLEASTRYLEDRE